MIKNEKIVKQSPLVDASDHSLQPAPPVRQITSEHARELRSPSEGSSLSDMSNVELLSKLRALDVIIRIEGNGLRCSAPAGVMTQQLREELAARKADLITLLKSAPAENWLDSKRIPRVPRDGNLPVSYAQQRLWFLGQMKGASEAYHIVLRLYLKGSLNYGALRRALDRIRVRHEVLRTTFAVSDEEVVQRVEEIEASPFHLIEHDLRGNNDVMGEFERLSDLEDETPFDFESGPIIRGRLIRISDEEHVLLITTHHIASDGWSEAVLNRELSTLYTAFLHGECDPLPALEIQYADYSAWQRQWMESDQMKQQAAFWKDTLAGAPALLDLPTDHPRPAVQDFQGAVEKLVFDEKLTAALKEFSKTHGVSLFMTVIAAWGALLARLSGQQHVVIGTPVANRDQNEIQGLIGFFVNTVAINLDFSGSPTVRDVIEQAKTKSFAALNNKDIPFDKVVELVQPARTLAYSPLFQVMFAWQNTVQEPFNLPGLEAQTIPYRSVKSKFDLLLDMRETAGVTYGIIEYATSLFEKTTVVRLIGYLRTLLQGMIANESVAIDRLPIMPEAERQQVLLDWNATEAQYENGASLAELIERQVARTPDAIAVADAEQHLTYQELNSLANQLAVELKNRGAGPDEVVGLCVERSASMVVALLAIMKSGAAYLPLDPWFPPERLAYMLEDSGTRLLVTEGKTRELLPNFNGTTILMEDDSWHANSSSNLAVTVAAEHLAYLIYTSGSTGKPKGVQIPRKALSNFLCSMREWLQLSEHDRILAVTTISFDIAGLEIWLPLLVGAQVVMASREDVADGTALRNLIEQHNITFLQATPVTWWLLLGAGWSGKPDMQAVCGGEAMPHELAAQLAPILKNFWNLYGPTETTIWSTGYLIEDASAPVLIGRPIGNTQCYILDSQHQPVPIGSIGELYIAGDGLARGYLNRPELTAEKFVANPFSPERNARMYRTGDLARYLPDGNIQCLGRTDHQVKLRGFRIELGEIEAALKQHPGIGQATVVSRGTTASEKKLVAYLIASRQPAPDSAELRAFLRQNLPDYMVPSDYVALESFPISPNGKIDIKALPDPTTVTPAAAISPELAPIESLLREYPEFTSVALILRPNAQADERPVVFAVAKNGEEKPLLMLRKYLRGRCPEKFIPERIVYLPELPSDALGAIDRAKLVEMAWGVEAAIDLSRDTADAPQTETEIELAEIWRDILKIPHAGVNDKFFDIGGHSLLSIQMISRVERETGYRFNLREILMNTLGQLAQKLSQETKVERPVV